MAKLAFVFPGQGSQAVGMMAELAQAYPLVQETFAEASEVLGYDLWALCQNGPADKLNQTEFTQPALLAAAYAAWRVYCAQDNAVKPDYLAGHSLGEYTAWVCSGAMQFVDGVTLVEKRGQLMQAAVPAGEGAMAAIIGLDDEVVTAVCKEAKQEQVCAPANFNSIGQVVIAGEVAAVERALVLAKEKGAKIAKMIPVSVPSHSPLMQAAADQLKPLLESVTIAKPEIPVVNNANVVLPVTPADIRQGLVCQLTRPVRWVETIQFFVNAGVNHIVECGPGKVLTGLNKRIDKSLLLTAYADPATLSTLCQQQGEDQA